MVPHNGENGNFSKLTYVPEGYKDGVNYKDTQPLEKRKNGFGSHDADRRDEFTNFIATERYREMLKKEQLLCVEKPGDIERKLRKLLEERQNLESSKVSSKRTFRNEKFHLYDIGRSRTTDFDPKSSKDRSYKFDPDHGREYGSIAKPIGCEIGELAWTVTYKAPKFGGKSEMRNFYDKSHLNVVCY